MLFRSGERVANALRKEARWFDWGKSAGAEKSGKEQAGWGWRWGEQAQRRGAGLPKQEHGKQAGLRQPGQGLKGERPGRQGTRTEGEGEAVGLSCLLILPRLSGVACSQHTRVTRVHFPPRPGQRPGRGQTWSPPRLFLYPLPDACRGARARRGDTGPWQARATPTRVLRKADGQR